jgi:GntR family transcriptional regulator
MSDILALDQLQTANGGPLYMKLRQAIEEAIQSGRLKHGDALPPERDMAEDASVSRVTVRKAIDDLVNDGLLVRRHGSGTFVVKPIVRMQQPLTQLTSFTEDMRRRGMTASTRWLDRGLFYPTADEMMALGLTSSAMIARLTRLRLADDILPDPQAVENSLYLVLEKSGIRPVRAIQRISACNLTDEETLLLGVPPGSAALSVQRMAYLQSGRLMEISKALYRSDAYDLVAELNMPNN